MIVCHVLNCFYSVKVPINPSPELYHLLKTCIYDFISYITCL